MAFDTEEYIRTRNEEEQAARSPKPGEPKPEQPKPETEDRTQGDSERSRRRRENQLREQAAEERGRRLALEELLEKGAISKKEPARASEPAKPERKDFADDASFAAALAEFSGKEGARQEIAKSEEKVAQERDAQEFMTEAQANVAKAEDFRKLFPDWDEVVDDEDDPTIQYSAAKHPMLATMIVKSDPEAIVAVAYYFGKHHDELREIIQAEGKPKQVDMFRRAQVRAMRMYGDRFKEAEEPAEKKEPEATPDPKKKLPRPSESLSVRGGTAPHSEISPFMEDGKTINPAWVEKRNQESQNRR